MQAGEADRRTMKKRVLIAGFTTRHVARSAYAAGYSVCAVDHFCDRDLSLYVEDCIRFEDLESLPGAIDDMSARHPCDMFVPTSGAELLDAPAPRLGPSPEKAAPFLNKAETAGFLSRLGIPAPALLPEESYPAMVKPRSGSGGWRNAVLRSNEEWRQWREVMEDPPAIWQELVEGLPASVCCVCNGTDARAVAVNEQLLRGGKEVAYGFSGSVTPFVHPLSTDMIRYAEMIAGESGCIGTIGVDFVVGEDQPYAIEVNPRFQGTVDTVEMATGVNLFSLHVNACEGRLPEKMPVPRQSAVRRILFAKEELVIKKDLCRFSSFISDIPHPGASFESGEAVVSVYGWGPDRGTAILMLDKHISTLTQYIGGRPDGRIIE
jgi:predicted ATP-grasp superfamily ATP-dependent carboligase